MKKKALRIKLIMALLLAALCCVTAVRLPMKDAVSKRVSLSDGEQALLLYPERAETEALPGVLMSWSDSRERLLCRIMAGELLRRDYCCCVVPAGSAEAGWALLEECSLHRPKGCLGFTASAEELRELALSPEKEELPLCTVLLDVATPELWEESAENVRNILLQLPQGVDKPAVPGFDVEKWADTEGTFSEGTARRAERKPEELSGTMTSVIDWLGSSLGRPNDGVLYDNEFLFNRQLVLILLSAAYLIYVPVSELRGKKKKTPPSIAEFLDGTSDGQEER